MYVVTSTAFQPFVGVEVVPVAFGQVHHSLVAFAHYGAGKQVVANKKLVVYGRCGLVFWIVQHQGFERRRAICAIAGELGVKVWHQRHAEVE